jgi:dTDP-4-dehydrorhamnose reductase
LSFKVLVRAQKSEITRSFVRLIEDTSIDVLGLDWDWDTLTSDELANLIRESKPHVALNVYELCLPESELEGAAGRMQSFLDVFSPLDLPFIHFSSYRAAGIEYVEKGLVEAPMPELGLVSGHPMLAIESLVAAIDKTMIMRCSWLIDLEVSGLLDVMLPSLLAGQSLVVSDHHFGTPVNCKFLARVALAVVQQLLTGAENWGVFHVHSADNCSEAEFCDHVIRALQKELDKEYSFPGIASRGDESSLMVGCALLLGRRCTDDFGIQLPTWRRGFSKILRRWLERNGHSTAAPEA